MPTIELYVNINGDQQEVVEKLRNKRANQKFAEEHSALDTQVQNILKEESFKEIRTLQDIKGYTEIYARDDTPEVIIVIKETMPNQMWQGVDIIASGMPTVVEPIIAKLEEHYTKSEQSRYLTIERKTQ